jgi:predicted transcriptional regulator
MMGVSVTTAQNSLKDLAEKGTIIKRERTARGYRLRGM